MDRYRFYAPNLATGTLVLSQEEAHHARAVLRLEGGAAVELFNGQGASAPGILARVSKREITVEVEKVSQAPAPSIHLTLATAVPKADRADWLIEQASQLNVSRVQWLTCDRAVVKPKEGGGKIDKWRRLAIESAKQCGRNYLMNIEPPRGLAAILQHAQQQSETLFWLEPRSGLPLAATLTSLDNLAKRLCALIGPEGGWSPAEIELLEHHPGIRRVKLTPTILRIETACAAVASACHLFSMQS